MRTETCIFCQVPATVWTCHVLRGKEKITAGWCKNHLYKSEDISLMKGPACFGPWKIVHGLLPDFTS